MKYKLQILTACLAIMAFPCFSQSFEGSISFRTLTDGLDRTLSMMVKDDKTVLEVETDSNEIVRIIKDYGKETTTLLRSRNELKYGFRIPSVIRSDSNIVDIENRKSNVTVEYTDEVKSIGNYKCTRVILKSPDAQAEGWVTTEVKFSLSYYFPEFLGSGVDPDLYNLRVEADSKGFIMAYHEMHPALDIEKSIEVTLLEKEISEDAFHIPAGFTVLDQNGMIQLFTEAQYDDVKKKQWEEFHGLFGKK